MKNLNPKTRLATLACFAGLIGMGLAQSPSEAPDKLLASELAPVLEVPRDIDLALCLDVSGSMDGLIDSAKQRLWALVNDLALAEPTPRLRVSLITYGNPLYGPDNGFVQIQVPLTDDLDLVSMKLFELTTNGGDEYVARVTQAATESLLWSSDPKALKMIVVAGNESAEQDPLVTLEVACGNAIAKGILVNTLYCSQGEGVQSLNMVQQVGVTQPNQAGPNPAASMAQPLDAIGLSWKKAAMLADGAFAMIDQNSGIVVLETPFDDRMVALSTELNGTYIPYGSGAEWNLSNQVAQDANASGLNREAAASRAQTKGGKLYFCSWDLVDAIGAEQVAFADIDVKLLPEALQAMPLAELEAHIESKRATRVEIQNKIATVGAQREAWLVTKRAELGTDESAAFDSFLREAFRDFAEARGFRFAQPKSTTGAVAPEQVPVAMDDC